MRTRCRAAAICFTVLASSWVEAAAITIVNLDAPGEGFNDTTVINEDDGFAAGTTLGQKRMAVFQEAAAIWAGKLQSNIEIRISARFDPLDCNSGTAVLGTAGPGAIAHGYPGLPYANTDYTIAAAEAISNRSIIPSNEFQVIARFNSSIDLNCFPGGRWWYGTQRYPSSLSNRVLLLPLVLHELAHSFGFASFACISSSPCGNTPAGGYSTGRLDAWSRFQADITQGLFWSQMTNAQRATSITNTANLVWDGPHVNAALPIWAANGIGLTNGYLQLHTPPQLNASASVSHWSSSLAVGASKLMMTPSTLLNQTFNVRTTDMTDCAFKDIGWPIVTTHCALGVNQAPVIAAPAEFLVAEDQFTVLRGIELADADSGNASIELRITASSGGLSTAATPFFGVQQPSTPPLTLIGSVENLNNFLDAGGLKFYPAADTAVLTLEANDLGRNGSGGPRIGTRTAMINIIPVNDPPVLGGALMNDHAYFQLTEGIGTQDLYWSSMTLTDDANLLPVRLDVLATTGALEATSNAVVTVTGDAAAKTLLGSPANIQAFFAASKFRWAMGDDPDSTGTVTFIVNDLGNTGAGGELTDTSVVHLSIQRWNDPPALNAPAAVEFYPGGSTPVNSIRVIDPDSRDGEMSLRVDVDAGWLVAGTTDGLVTVTGSGFSSMRINGSRANINTFIALNKLVYVSPAATDRSALMQLHILDGGNTGDVFSNLDARATINLVGGIIFLNGFEQ